MKIGKIRKIHSLEFRLTLDQGLILRLKAIEKELRKINDHYYNTTSASDYRRLDEWRDKRERYNKEMDDIIMKRIAIRDGMYEDDTI